MEGLSNNPPDTHGPGLQENTPTAVVIHDS